MFVAVEIWQVKRNIDERHDISFMRYDYVKKRIPDLAKTYKDYYEKVYEYGEEIDVPEKVYLEQVFTDFNINRPDDFKGHSLSVSDLVKLNDNLYFCDSFGYELLR